MATVFRGITTTAKVLTLGVIIFFAGRHFLVAPPADFPVPYQLTIEHGQSLFSVSQELAAAHVIRSRQAFEMFMLTLGNDKGVSEGEFFFTEPVTSFEVALRITGKNFGTLRHKITFPEGFTTKEMNTRLTATFSSFDSATFQALADPLQGYLFPDTYAFFASTKPQAMIDAMRTNYRKKVGPLQADITASGHTESEIITMASIIEKEASGEVDRGTISGILWKRIEKGIPLQVDAPFLFLLGKESKDLTVHDLAMKSPYNTYLNKGLPPGPINNPGIDAIVAALHPADSPYLYYLHDSTGAIHYARTYAEHQQNIKRYLK